MTKILYIIRIINGTEKNSKWVNYLADLAVSDTAALTLPLPLPVLLLLVFLLPV